MKKLILTVSSILLSLNLFSQLKGLDEFKEIPYPTTHDTLVEYRKVFATSPYGGYSEYFYAMPSTPQNIDTMFRFIREILELNDADIENPTYNHNKNGEVWVLDDGFEAMSQQTVNFYKMVRREWEINTGVDDNNIWYVQLEVFNGHAFFRAGPK